MKQLMMFYLDDCGYCRKAFRALDELYSQYPEYSKIKLDCIEETRNPELSDRYDYYAVPCFYLGDEKLFEAHIGMTYEQIREAVMHCLDCALHS